jgi:membrane-bound ClpP family serine protease
MIEVFVLPGFGIFGLGGGLLVIFSLVLASQTFVLPRTPSDLAELRRSVTVVAAAGAGLMALAVAGRRLLPHAPLLNRMILVPPAPEEKALLDVREKLADYEFLVGSRGVAQTHLRPAGKALIDGQLCDVTAEADWVERGSTVTVVSARANRIVVRSAEK